MSIHERQRKQCKQTELLYREKGGSDVC